MLPPLPYSDLANPSFPTANGFANRFREKAKLVLKATRQHARNLSTFAIVYKLTMIVLRNINPSGAGKEGRYDSFFAGLMGGYTVFGRQPGSVSQQVWTETLLYFIPAGYLNSDRIFLTPCAIRLSSTSLLA